MSTAEQTRALAVPRAKRKGSWRRELRDTWWRHLVGIVAVVFSLFPIAYVASGAFSAVPSIGAAQLIPDKVSLHNFWILFHDPSTHYVRWYANTMIIATVTAIFTVLIGALAAYAFSRFRFKGRRMGLMSLLLIQMFPQLLLIVAIYLIVLYTGKVFGFLALNTLTGLIIVYLAGAMGVNTWLLKGFFDTIPAELDESARVDGATPAQVFWGVVLPLAAPVLAVIGLFSFIGVINEFVIASVLLQNNEKFTLALGLRSFIDQQYSEHWGPFAAGVLLAAPPVVLLFLFLQRFIVSGLTGGAVKG
jgi:arabinogalactan oligomer / maltooligosaccharide transport system permease protein